MDSVPTWFVPSVLLFPDFQQPADLPFMCATFPFNSHHPVQTASRLPQSSLLDLSMMQAAFHYVGVRTPNSLSIHSFNKYLLINLMCLLAYSNEYVPTLKKLWTNKNSNYDYHRCDYITQIEVSPGY